MLYEISGYDEIDIGKMFTELQVYKFISLLL